MNHPESQHNPESGTKEDTSLQNIIRDIKERLNEMISRIILKKEYEEQAAFEQTVEKSATISKQGGEYYRHLIKTSSTTPEKNYVHEEKKSDYFEYFANALIETQKSLKLRAQSEFQQTMSKIKQEMYDEKLDRDEKEIDEERTIQFAYFQFKQQGGDNVIHEEIDNDLINDVNVAFSELKIRDSKTGTMLDLELLLPKNCTFSPAELNQADYEIDEEGEKPELKKIPIQVNLDSYQGTEGAEGNFAFHYTTTPPEVKRIEYGDLTSKGSVLSLLHEIAHAWQNEYYDHFGGPVFKKFYKEVSLLLHLISYAKNKVGNDELSQEVYKQVSKSYKEALVSLGVEINEDKFIYQDGDVLNEGEYKLTDYYKYQRYVIKSEKLQQLIKDYERQERDAWAHAIKMLRFLRKQGIDVEPGLQTSKDIMEVVNPCLHSYQESVDDMIESATKQVRFARHR